ncbi:MAG: indole-3-glycerol phosphate synthase TrpC [Bacteroides sp.]|nr:indole-3-glycerol phosphate synthase TrpC [Bacteroides sp.]MBQ7351237.1 indole-3-glycerol phosphate synthase TrpC [Bacteroides sp.]MBQ8240791.1 indole-3-glycerol phosphate synthase TrpC [Bacteroides sp.]MBQ8805830.1 indole-3-glycerol phosphate synthase TrpC [Bacteroidaceae bacterium]
MKDILDEIVANKRMEVARQKEAVSLKQLADLCDLPAVPYLSMKAALEASATGIIAEFKRRSPSKGWIKEEGDAHIIPPGYEQAGASALSILTDETFFGGSLKDIQMARPLVKSPILRKDFIIDEYQLYQAKAVGANAVLLIAACLTIGECKALAAKAHHLSLEVLLEVHQEKELEYIGSHTDMVGVNNRNLGTFHTDVENSFRMAELLPKDMLKVSESGISRASTIKTLREVGFRGFLIGETFMKTEEPDKALRELINGVLC